MIENVLLHDGTLDGIFTAVYDGFVLKKSMYGDGYKDNIAVACKYNYVPSLFCNYIEVETDEDKAGKTVNHIVKVMGIDAYDTAMGVACHFSEDAGEVLFGFLVRGFKVGKGITAMFTDKYVMRAFELSRKVYNESHLMREFLRFTDVGGKLYAKIEPKCNIVHMMCNHFADRFPGENWIIYDSVHHVVAVHPKYQKWFLTDDVGVDYEKIDKATQDGYVDLWKLFVDTIAIEERRNERCQNNHMPKWYRKNMTEWK